MRILRGLAAGLALIITTAGCVQLPQPVTETAPAVEPAWTRAQAQARRQQVLAGFARAVRADNLVAASEGLVDSDRRIAVGQFTIAGINRSRPKPDTWRAGTGPRSGPPTRPASRSRPSSWSP